MVLLTVKAMSENSLSNHDCQMVNKQPTAADSPTHQVNQPLQPDDSPAMHIGDAAHPPVVAETELSINHFRFEQLAGKQPVVHIELHGITYTLRRTRAGRVIHNKSLHPMVWAHPTNRSTRCFPQCC